MTQVTIINCAAYSINKATEMAYQIDYSEGTKVRVVVGAGMVRNEYLKDGAWVQSGKAYVVAHNKQRQAERAIKTVKEWIAVE